MRALQELTSDLLPAQAELRARARKLVDAPAAKETIDALVSDLATGWAQSALFCQRCHETRPEPPNVPPSLFGLAASREEREVGEWCAKIVTARALAEALLSRPPSAQTLERLDDVLLYASWEEFMGAIGGMAGNPSASEWVEALDAPDYEGYVRNAIQREREAFRQASERWRACPRVLGQRSDSGRTPLGSCYATALPIIRQLDIDAWFEALRRAPLRAEIEHAVYAVSRRPSELLRMLDRAPIGVDSHGNETGHVATIMLAEKAWEYPVEVGGVLQGRIRAGSGAEVREAEDDYAAFVDSEVQPWLDQVWAVLRGRPDGEELSLAIAVRHLAGRTREGGKLQGQSSAAAKKVADELESRLSALYRPRLQTLARLLDAGDLGRHYDSLERWRAFARIACDDVGDVAKGARAAWDRFVALLSDWGEPVSLRAPEQFAPDTWDIMGFVLAQQPQPGDAFTGIFDRLLLERERARMGVRVSRNGSDLPATPVCSRVAICTGAHALLQHPVQAAPASLWRVVFAALREIWLSSADTRENHWLVLRCYHCGAVAQHRLPGNTPAAKELHEELVDGLRYLATDPCMSCEVAELWLEAGWSPGDVVEAFRQGGIDIRWVCALLLAEPSEWRHGQAALQSLTLALGSSS